MAATGKKLASGKSAIPYDSYFDYLYDELRKLDIVLEAFFQKKNSKPKRSNLFTTDLYISPDYISSLFSEELEKGSPDRPLV